MATLTFKKPQLIMFGTNKVTDHNRDSLQISVERIEKKQRMANGRMRKYVVADKHTFSTSWKMIPGPASASVDGFWSANDMEAFYEATQGEFQLVLTFTKPDLSGTYTETYTVMFDNFDKTLLKRGKYDFYDVSVTLEEV